MRSRLLTSSALYAVAALAAGPAGAASLSIPFGPVADQQTNDIFAPGQDIDIDIAAPANVVSFDRLDLVVGGDVGSSLETLEVALNGVSLGTILNNVEGDDRFDFPADAGNDFTLLQGGASNLSGVPVRAATTLSFKPSGSVDFLGAPGLFDVFPLPFTYAVEGALTVTVPDVWIAQSGGAFDDGASWLGGVSPTDGAPLPTFINPDRSQTILGPEGFVEVAELQLGAGAGRAELEMQGGSLSVFAVDDPLRIESNGVLSGEGTVAALFEGVRNAGAIDADDLVIEGDVENLGEIEATELVIRGDLANGGEIDADDLEIEGRLTNTGEYRGGGDVGGDILNDEGGLIEVGAGETLESSGGVANAGGGEIRLLGGALEADEQVENFDARIVGRDAKIDGAEGVTNSFGGQILLSGAANDIFGFVQNLDPGDGTLISNAGGGLLTFYDDVFNAAAIETLTGGRTVFLDGYSGSGALTGGGAFFMRGEFAPGSSPGLTNVTGDLTLSGESLFELGGTARGVSYDATDVSGVLTLGGDLAIVNFDGFLANPGDRFTLFMASEILGDFASVSFPDLASGRFRIFRTDTAFGVAAVPLPAAGWMLIAGLGALAALRRRAA